MCQHVEPATQTAEFGLVLRAPFHRAYHGVPGQIFQIFLAQVLPVLAPFERLLDVRRLLEQQHQCRSRQASTQAEDREILGDGSAECERRFGRIGIEGTIIAGCSADRRSFLCGKVVRQETIKALPQVLEKRWRVGCQQPPHTRVVVGFRREVLAHLF